MRKQDFQRIEDYVWEIPASFRDDMQVPARLYASDRLLEAALGDESVDQLVNTATLPGLVKYSLAMPDIHQGYGFPIGGVIASRTGDGVISPGGVGYDINCGVRVLSSGIEAEDIVPFLSELASTLYRNCPSGVGKGGNVKLNDKQFKSLLHEGSSWALKAGYALPEDVRRTEEQGCLKAADAGKVSSRALSRGIGQVGTLGAGNHFIEVDIVDEVFDANAADAMGLVRGRVAVQVHTGSRGFGHQVCTDYVRQFQEAVRRYGISLPDRQLICAPFHSEEGQSYYGAMCAAANYAFVNRQVLTHHIRRSFEQVLSGKLDDWHLRLVYDIAHNMAKVEKHNVDGKTVEVVVHRKGATRAFGPGYEGLPPEYKDIGQPVLVPGSMGTSSWVLTGTEDSMNQTFGSSCHGAGRVMSRKKAKSTIRGDQLRAELEESGISVQAGSLPGLAEEAPRAYKDVDEVVKVVTGAGIAKKVARLIPLAVIKG
ncbi:MAG: RtcB family protein [Anaerolineae bacterium]|nr:RtcB family protein [Anaerolineae bacterium]